MTISASDAARLLGRKGGIARASASTEDQRSEWSSKGAETTNSKLTSEQRSARGKAAATARWAKAKREKGEE